MENERGVRVILKWMLQEWGGGWGPGLLWPRIGTADELFCTSHCIVGTPKYRELLEPLRQRFVAEVRMGKVEGSISVGVVGIFL